MTTEQYSIGYDEGYQAGWNEAMEANPAQQQEPVAVIDSTISGNIDWRCVVFPKDGTKLYTTPPQRKPLTDEEWQVIADTLDCLITRKQKDAIEAVIGIKEEA